ncbi:2-amino-4-hydroxy-6-hydroxymethyldihydropteridine diphosphokinase [Enterovirga rhinocerotis]|uniref:2-amino-4-hydroxy-6-hydroxymethyldihydropteridine pyrophosphokinase n=1 Tax=Enterovirga rhinocerotis TaxID=1339210 RepID=A0A4R7C541_9HYPH|nr:2-amino-4-hydroxy-6-hydroxymethyldihydropteridine diphosphokinase [Enterovirga rhinocerotis]TDR93664.1 2-amino-4-hydroxy-6-hydroxymethyldihydropteridine diphosphokinase [Enterovirga rhinocerotis]
MAEPGPAEREAWLSLGANLGDREAGLREAVRRLGATPGIVVEAVSSLYETPPWGDADQGPFLNCAAAIRTTLAPQALLGAAKAIEAAIGRTETRRWGPRVIDIDIVHMAGIALSDETLTLPHRHWRERAFVLVPLAEIAPELVIDRTAVTAALAACDVSGIRRLDGETRA